MEMLATYGFALLGGIILNGMPCVLPVIMMKVFHVVEQAKHAPSINRKHGVVYAAGILLFFVGVAALAITAKAAGERFMPSTAYQFPLFGVSLTTILFVLGLNSFGVFEITVGMSVEGGSGYKGSFINGLVAAVMAIPCSAPMLGLALPVAVNPATPWFHTLGLFLAIGFGLALPFLIISFVPAVSRVLPKPGAWMNTLKKVLGFALFAATVWLFNTTVRPILSPHGSEMFLYFLVVVGVACWAYGQWGGPEHSDGRRWLVRGLTAGGSLAAALLLLDLTPHAKAGPELAKDSAAPVIDAAALETQLGELGLTKAQTEGVLAFVAGADPPVVVGDKINWVAFDETTIKANLSRNRPVFMDFTAEWCANCKTNEKLFIETETIRNVLTKTNILPMKADFTNEDAKIEKWIDDLGRAGIPIYVILHPDGHRDLLPEAITTEMLSSALERAAEKYPRDKMSAPGTGGKPGAADPGAKHAAAEG
jgi:thiol:disulfide interchange protein